MRWSALNGFGALCWLIGLYMALSAVRPGLGSAWLPSNPWPFAFALALVGLGTLLWANLRDA